MYRKYAVGKSNRNQTLRRATAGPSSIVTSRYRSGPTNNRAIPLTMKAAVLGLEMRLLAPLTNHGNNGKKTMNCGNAAGLFD